MGVAVNVTDVPAQTGLAEGEMLMLTGSVVFTLIVIVLDVAGLPEGQITFDVSTQVTKSLFKGV